MQKTTYFLLTPVLEPYHLHYVSSVTTVCTENMSAEKKETAFGDQNKFANFFNVYNKKEYGNG